MQKNRNTQGFTIIELLVVILVIGILAAISIPNLINAKSRAYDTAALSCASSLSRAVAIYKTEHPLTVAIPAASHYYGDATKHDKYGTQDCGRLVKENSATIVGIAAPKGDWKFEVTHLIGSKTYVVSDLGIVKV